MFFVFSAVKAVFEFLFGAFVFGPLFGKWLVAGLALEAAARAFDHSESGFAVPFHRTQISTLPKRFKLTCFKCGVRNAECG